MKALFIAITVALSLPVLAQSHRIGISGGTNKMYSWESGEPPLGIGSPFESKLGYSVNLSYSYIFSNNITVNLRNSLTFLSYQADDFFAFRDFDNEVVNADLKYFERYYHASLGGGYLFNVSDRYSINAEAGASMFYYFKEIAYSEGYPETRVERKQEWEADNRYYGIFLTMVHNYRIFRNRNYSLHLTGSLRATQVFDYLNISQDLSRVLPELTLGVAVAFGKPGRGLF